MRPFGNPARLSGLPGAFRSSLFTEAPFRTVDRLLWLPLSRQMFAARRIIRQYF